MSSKPDSAVLRGTVRAAFTRQYGMAPSHISRAPGRVNIIGEHTDYNDGFVLPAAIYQAIYIAGKRRQDRTVRVQSLDYGGSATFSLDNLRDDTQPAWTNYLRGVLWIIEQEGFNLTGMDLTITGDLPHTGGFSSSAAVEVAMFEIVNGLCDIPMAQKDKALLGVEVEHKFIGVPCGVMDQMISALGKEGHALLIDCRSLATTPVPVPPGVSLVALDTGKRRELVNSEYGKRRGQCEEAARLLGVKALRDVTPEQLAAQADKLPEVIYKRAAHVVSEDVRTLATVEALKAGDLEKVGQLLNDGHASLRDLFQISIPELDLMADLAQKEPGCYGARMMGGGFGGPVIALVDDDAVKNLSENVARAYQAATQIKPSVYAVKAGPGSSIQRIN